MPTCRRSSMPSGLTPNALISPEINDPPPSGNGLQSTRMKTFAEFWPFYLREHRNPLTRALHFTGTSLSILLVLSALALRRPLFIVAALLCGYAFAWVGHFFVEHNKPATFTHPLWSFAA